MDLPNLNWLMDSRNKEGISMVFTGSRRFDPTKPCFDSPSFNYKLQLKEEQIHASCDITGSAESGFILRELDKCSEDATEEGLNQINLWLEEIYNREINK